MEITALLVLKSPGGEPQQALVLANASDFSHFGYIQRSAARECIIFVARLVALPTPAGSRQNVQHEEYMVHCYNENGLCTIAVTDAYYPVRSAFSLLNIVLEEYQKTFGESWKTTKIDVTQPWQYLDDALTKYQDPAEADKLLKIQRDLDQTKIVLITGIEGYQCKGADIHGFTSELALMCALAEAGAHCRPLNTNEACAVLMNAPLFAPSPALSDGADAMLYCVAGIEGFQWRGANIHGFASELALRRALAEAEARSRYLTAHEALAFLQNARRFQF